MALPCAWPGCANTTIDPSIRCHVHRGSYTEVGWRGSLPSVAPPRLGEQWRSGQIHPTGGYDNRVDEEFDNEDEIWTQTEYARNGKTHRLDGPAVVTSDAMHVLREQWYVENLRHRIDGPAVVDYHDGVVSRETYYTDNELHRLDGPAMTNYRLDGGVDWARFFVRGEEVDAEKHARIREALDSGAPEEWARAYAEGERS